jgi:GTP cyclohydrolase I
METKLTNSQIPTHSLTPQLVRQSLREFIAYIGDNPDREGLIETPDRILRSWSELFSGYQEEPERFFKLFTQDTETDDMVVISGIEYFSMCVPSSQTVCRVENKPGYPAAKARNIKIGDELWTLKDGIPVKTKVSHIQSRKVTKLVKLSLSTGITVRLTLDHPVKLQDRWEEAGNLKSGHYIEFINRKTLRKSQYDFNLGYDLGYAVGVIAAEGSIQDDRRVCVEVNSYEYMQRYQQALKNAFALETTIEKIKKPSGFTKKVIRQYRVRFVSSQIAKRLLKLLGLPQGMGSKSKTKKFHFPQILATSKDMMKGFLDGYIEGDGSKHRTGHIITSGNLQFLQELGNILNVRFYTQNSSYNGKSVGQLFVGKHWDSAKWTKKHGFSPIAASLDIGESELVEITNVEILDQPGKSGYKVFSFTCEPYPTFLVNGVLTHNCEHHAIPFYGEMHIGYVPDGHILGLSKFARLVNVFARRLQTEEHLVSQIADTLMQYLTPQGVIVISCAKHLCACGRGVNQRKMKMGKSALRGNFRQDNALKQEFFELIKIHLNMR